MLDATAGHFCSMTHPGSMSCCPNWTQALQAAVSVIGHIMKQNKVVKMADHEASRENRRKRDSRAILDSCQKLAVEHLVRAFPAMMDKVDDALFDRVNQSENAADHSVYFDTMRDMRLKRSDINAEFKKRFAVLSEDVIKEYGERLEFELQVIKKMGFAGYFLIVADFIEHARQLGIPVGPGRGSAGPGGS